MHPYEATESTDLSFAAGERITVLERDGDWWVGRIGQRSGTFPRNYVEKVETVRSIVVRSPRSILILVCSRSKKPPRPFSRSRVSTKVVCPSTSVN